MRCQAAARMPLPAAEAWHVTWEVKRFGRMTGRTVHLEGWHHVS
jgi:hypothetical protein